MPKRSDQRHGHRSKQQQAATTKVKVTDGPANQPPPDSSWHPIAQRLWVSLGKSAQSIFYEPSDWALAWSLMDDLSYYKNAPKRSGQMLASIMSALSNLLITEGDRRRVQLELQRGPGDAEDTTKVVEMNKWKQRLG